MNQLNDVAVAFYQEALVSTSNDINQLELEWLKLQGATSEDVNDAWQEFLFIGGFESKTEWLSSLGHTGQLNDQLYEFYTTP